MTTGIIEPVGYESSNRIGKLELHAREMTVLLANETIHVPLVLKNRKEYYYLDAIANNVNGFTFVAHVVKSDGVETDVKTTLFLQDEAALALLQAYMDHFNRNNRDEGKERQSNQRTSIVQKSTGKGWLSRRR